MMDHWRSYLRGRVLEAFGRRAAAVEAYREALKAVPGFSRASNRAAFVLAALDRFEEAEALSTVLGAGA
jgi:tetratricopeptide (TPR) repeat protein